MKRCFNERSDSIHVCQTVLSRSDKPRASQVAFAVVRLTFVIADRRLPEFPEAPTIMEFVKDDVTRQTINLLTVTRKLERPILAPPNTPADRLRELRNALAATVRDATFLEETKKEPHYRSDWR